jgi:small subunit ribosomal protein S16
VIGNYEPRSGKFEIDAEKAKKWISQGVQPSDTIYNFLVENKIVEGRKKNVLPKKSPVIDEAKLKAEAEAKTKAEAAEAAAKAKAEEEANAPKAEETPVAA